MTEREIREGRLAFLAQRRYEYGLEALAAMDLRRAAMPIPAATARDMTYVWEMGFTPTVGARLELYFYNLGSWRDILPALEAISPDGDWSSYDDAVSYTRVFSVSEERSRTFPPELQLPGKESYIERWTVQVHATLVGDTDECRRVIVGYDDDVDYYDERQPNPVYEFKCGEEE